MLSNDEISFDTYLKRVLPLFNLEKKKKTVDDGVDISSDDSDSEDSDEDSGDSDE
jgi:hypothetical protein